MMQQAIKALMGKLAMDRSKLTPLALEVIDARDSILRVVVVLGDDRKAAMALTYAVASFADHLALVAHRPADDIVKAFFGEVIQTIDEGVMTVDVTDLEADGTQD